MNIIWLILAVLIWGVVHSYLASSGAKKWMRRVLGENVMRFYRFGYNIFSVVSFLPILWLMVALPDRVLYQIPAPWMYLLLAGQLAAAVLLGGRSLADGYAIVCWSEAAFRGERTFLPACHQRTLPLGTASALHGGVAIYLVDTCDEPEFPGCFHRSDSLHSGGGLL